MRVTIGERLGIKPHNRPTVKQSVFSDESAPTWVEPEAAGPVMSFYGAPSSTLPLGHQSPNVPAVCPWYSHFPRS